MKIKLVNKQTKEEHICSKVVIDGFDYYYIDELIPYNPNGGTNGNFVCLGEIESNKDHNVKLGDKQYISPFVKNVGDCGGCRKLIATNNPSIDLPKIVNEIRNLAQKTFGGKLNKKDDKIVYTLTKGYLEGFITGYNKSQESHPFSEEDMIEFSWWLVKNLGMFSCDRTAHFNKELLQIWKEQRIKIIYYN